MRVNMLKRASATCFVLMLRIAMASGHFEAWHTTPSIYALRFFVRGRGPCISTETRLNGASINGVLPMGTGGP